MSDAPARITLSEWERRCSGSCPAGNGDPGPLRRHLDDGDLRLAKLVFDNCPASLRLWDLLLSENDRLATARASGQHLVGAMKDLGTVPVIAYAFDRVTAFYPDGAWWAPCVMELNEGSLRAAEALGLGESFCPVRAMLGAFVTGEHFPIPDLIVCSTGAVCDDVAAIAQRIESLGHPIVWWEIPHRRRPEPGEISVELPGGLTAPAAQVAFVQAELSRVKDSLESLTGQHLDDERLALSIRKANALRRTLTELRRLTFTAPACPFPALELLIAEMLALHFCSDPEAATSILDALLAEVRHRVRQGHGMLPEDAVRVFWVNPVADLRVMNLLEECGGRICGTDYLFTHTLDAIPEDLPPLDALARTALADPMVGPAQDRAERICRDARAFGSEAVVISRIPGASHCATEGAVIKRIICEQLRLPVVEIEVPPVSDSIRPTLRTRLEALIETARKARRA